MAVITGLDREERRDAGRPNTAGCGRRAEVGVGECAGEGVSVQRNGNQAAEEVTSPLTPALPLHLLLLTLGFLSNLFFFLYLGSLGPSSHTSTRWPVRIKIKALEASSCQSVFCFFIWVL